MWMSKVLTSDTVFKIIKLFMLNIFLIFGSPLGHREGGEKEEELNMKYWIVQNIYFAQNRYMESITPPMWQSSGLQGGYWKQGLKKEKYLIFKE